MNIIIDNIPVGNRRPAKKREVKFIVAHNTGNPTSTAKNERAWLTNPNNDRQASFNYVVDEHDIIQCIPDYEITWNAGDGGSGKGNVNGLSIEICESGNYKVGEQKAIELIAQKMVEHKLTLDSVKPHQFFSGKNCPHIILPYWFDFLASVKFEYDKLTKKEVAKLETVKIDKTWQELELEQAIKDGRINSVVKVKKHWCEDIYNKLNEKGIEIDEQRFEDKVTRAEMFAMVDKVLTFLGK